MPIRKYKTNKQRQKATLETVARYHAKATRCINVRYHNVNDKEILEKLDSVPNKADYIRKLILADIRKDH